MDIRKERHPDLVESCGYQFSVKESMIARDFSNEKASAEWGLV